MKKTFIFIAVLLFSLTPCVVNSAEINTNLIDSKIKNIGFWDFLSADDNQAVTNVLEQYTKYSNKHNLEKLNTLYADNFLSSDGFDKKTMLEMINKTWSQYPNISYATNIKNIYINGDYAIAEVFEQAKGFSKERFELIPDEGIIESNSHNLYYFTKIGRQWFLTSDYMINEVTSMKYGEAKYAQMKFSAPSVVAANQEYTTTLEVKTPKNMASTTVVIASLSAEPIIYPQAEPKEVFRGVKEESLERVFKANKNGNNEYAVASVGFTRTSIIDEASVKVDITGMAFVMSRVNVLPPKNASTSVRAEIAPQ